MSSRLQTFKISSLKKTTAVLQVSSNISSKPAVALQLCHSVQNTNRRNVEQAFTLRALKIYDSRKKKKEAACAYGRMRLTQSGSSEDCSIFMDLLSSTDPISVFALLVIKPYARCIPADQL